jgi:hypothetical protein
MVLKVTFRLIDDLDGSTSKDVERVSFGLDGAKYEIDLTASNASQLRRLLARYIEAARCVGRTPAPSLTPAHLRSVTNGTPAVLLVNLRHQDVGPLVGPEDRKSA